MKKQNDKRIFYLDVLKVISILMMVFIHVLSFASTFTLTSSNFDEDTAYNISGIVNIFTPTIFMLCMGCGLYLSKNNTPSKLAKRGLHLLLIGLLLNVVRGSIFYAILSAVEDISYISESWYWLWGSDIMYFAGLFFLLYALMRKLKLKDSFILLIGAAMFAISCLVPVIEIKNETLNLIVGNFVYLNIDSYFPLLTWTIFPIIGFYFQKYYEKTKDKDSYVAKIGIVSLIVFVALYLILKSCGLYQDRYLLWAIDEQLIDAPTFLLTISINFVYIGAIYLLSKLIKSIKIRTLIGNISAKINTIYCTHWILIMYIGLIFYLFTSLQIANMFQLIVVTIIIFTLAVLISYLIKAQHKTKAIR